MSTTDDNPAQLTAQQRLSLFERDHRDYTRIITEIVEKTRRASATGQIAQIRTALRNELADAGLRLDNAKHQDLAREDFRFLRRLRSAGRRRQSCGQTRCCWQ